MSDRDEWGAQVAGAIAVLMQRGTRAQLYGILVEGVGPAINETTYPVLSGLARTGPRSAAVLATEIGIDRSVTSRHASRLEAAGLLRREPDPSDRRATLLVLTPDGERVVEVMRRRLARAVGDYLATWDPAEAGAFVASLSRFVEEGPWDRLPASTGTDSD
ncbi:MarR family winged helix-turn-helix transcriptional regulator [Streptomyces scopuliridis]|uniref:MarR family winged helix-turn-helix transcriptional regulator n=1 Tax=Streptomyces scopuliridis TaxID=452529 RepID=UPI00369A7A9E